MTREFQLVDGGDAVVPEEPVDEQFNGEIGPETPDADALEQATLADPAENAEPEGELPIEADPADAVEQRRAVPGVDEYE